ncbi:carcinoembryonic antigen-related cell adhesion molecule 4-like [Dromiciops gliroides]|uniref:carcinoembryonic antigen-related cell adhesion molecule 4-like n=1 Tax=Dromiciops gliroides TaxID=33562 RepID=UPI001CC5805C|nr:carcinoembryonic antigen-related cell adhesion molecule 4-like [Dromiciops gliroides]
MVTPSGWHRPMESPSEASHIGGSPWKGLLITAAVLSTWIQSESTQSTKMRVEPSPPYGMVGGSITLSILGLTAEPTRYTWFRNTADEANTIVTYNVQTRQQTPSHGRETVFHNGSLLITNLTLSDSDKYLVTIFSAVPDGGTNYQLSILSSHLQVYDSNSRGKVTAGIVIGVLAGAALIGALIYVLFIRKIRGASQGMLGDPGPEGNTQLAQKRRQAPESNIYWPQESTHSPQGLGSTPTSSAAAPENVYQALDVSKVAIYDSFDAMRKPQTKEGGRSP